GVGLELFGEIADPLAEERDLHFRGTRVALVGLEAVDDLGLPVLREHAWSFHERPRPSERHAPHRTAVYPLFTDGSIFYLRTRRGCKSPSARVSATDRRRPEPSSTRTRRSGPSAANRSWRCAGPRVLPFCARRRPSSVRVT